MNFEMKVYLTDVFRRLSWQPSNETQAGSLSIIDKFVSHVYAKTTTRSLNELWFELFKSSSSNSFRELPPSRQSLELHIMRSAYQAGWVWGNSFCQETPPSVEDFGWIIHNGQLLVKWVKEPDEMKLPNLVKTCRCKSASKSNNKRLSCTCGKLDIACLEQCKCNRSCQVKL